VLGEEGGDVGRGKMRRKGKRYENRWKGQRGWMAEN
jgi:hypothetical protein